MHGVNILTLTEAIGTEGEGCSVFVPVFRLQSDGSYGEHTRECRVVCMFPDSNDHLAAVDEKAQLDCNICRLGNPYKDISYTVYTNNSGLYGIVPQPVQNGVGPCS